MKCKILIFIILFFPVFFSPSYAHTIDSVEEYRLEIGWMKEPVVSGETNGIELYVSPFDSSIPVEEQEFTNGIAGLEKTLKIQLVLKQDKITLPLSSDHNIPGKYYAFVDPTVSGFYQANILGDIKGTPISISMHPPKVEERQYIEFPEPSDITLRQMIDGHTALIEDINDLKDSVKQLENSNLTTGIGYIGIILGSLGIIIASIAISKIKR